MEHSELVKNLIKPGNDIRNSLNGMECHIQHMCLGIAGESGELIDAIKKAIIYKKEINYKHIIEEMGDLEFYLEGLRQGLGINRSEVIENNIVKLTKRYSSGSYSNEQANERADKPDEPK